MKRLMIMSLSILFLFSMPVIAADSAVKIGFLEACDSSPHIDEDSSCICVFNEVVHQFGEEDAAELIPFISGDQEMERDIGDSLAFIAGKCES